MPVAPLTKTLLANTGIGALKTTSIDIVPGIGTDKFTAQRKYSFVVRGRSVRAPFFVYRNNELIDKTITKEYVLNVTDDGDYIVSTIPLSKIRTFPRLTANSYDEFTAKIYRNISINAWIDSVSIKSPCYPNKLSIDIIVPIKILGYITNENIRSHIGAELVGRLYARILPRTKIPGNISEDVIMQWNGSKPVYRNAVPNRWVFSEFTLPIYCENQKQIFIVTDNNGLHKECKIQWQLIAELYNKFGRGNMVYYYTKVIIPSAQKISMVRKENKIYITTQSFDRNAIAWVVGTGHRKVKVFNISGIIPVFDDKPVDINVEFGEPKITIESSDPNWKPEIGIIYGLSVKSDNKVLARKVSANNKYTITFSIGGVQIS